MKLHNRPAIKIKTLTVPDVKVDPNEVKRVLEEYQSRYQRTKEETEAAIARVSVPISDTDNGSSIPGQGKESSNPAYTNLFSRRNGQENKLSN